MVQFNFSERTIKAKVVYYGPAQSGKTTNLEQIHALTDPGGHNRLISLNTAQDRTLFFDLLPFSLGAVAGYDFKVQLYTVPGQVQYNATRRVVLAGADAVVFVADSRRSAAKENVAAFENMKVNLLANRLVPEKVPLVLQFNKQDLPDLIPVDELGNTLNVWKRPSFKAVAFEGEGVLETFAAVVKQMLATIAVKYSLKEKGLDPDIIPEMVDEAFSNLLNEASSEKAAAPEAAVAPPVRMVLSPEREGEQSRPLQASPEAGLVSEELLHRSIRTNVELAEALSNLVRDMSRGLQTIQSQAEMLMVLREDAQRREALAKIQNEAVRLRGVVQQLGQAEQRPAAAATPPAPPPPAPADLAPGPAPTPAARPAAPPSPAAPAAPRREPAAASPPTTLDAALRAGIEQAQAAIGNPGLQVDFRSGPAALPPRVPAANVVRAMSLLLQGVSASAPGSAVQVRTERKPVLLRGRDGSEIKREFVMIAAAHENVLRPEQQQQAARGADAGPFGSACRAIKETRGFVRFAPHSDGGLETRFFLPAT